MYNEVFDVAMEKYGVEDKVDRKIEQAKNRMREAVWRIAKDIGWSALSQIGEVVTFVKDSANSYNQEHSTNEGRGSSNSTLRMKKDQSSESLLTRKPSHSVMEGMSSFSSVEAISDVVEREVYAVEFISMLKEGLYVFAAHDGPVAKRTVEEFDSSSSKRFRLRIFFYESDDEGDVSNDHEPDPYFVLHPVDANAENVQNDIEIISLADVKDIRQCGTNGIALIGHSEVSSKDLISAPTAAAIPEDTEIIQSGLTARDTVLAEIVLSNVDDRETLFQGMKFCFRSIGEGDSAADDNIDENTMINSHSGSENSIQKLEPLSSNHSDIEFVDWNNEPHHTKVSTESEVEDVDIVNNDDPQNENSCEEDETAYVDFEKK